jgi:hypothetical protein
MNIMTTLNVETLRLICQPDNTTLKLKVRQSPSKAQYTLDHLDPALKHMTEVRMDRNKDQLVPTLKHIRRYGKDEGTVQKYSVTGGYGRFYVKTGKSYVTISRPVRHFLARDIYADIDIDNCHPVIVEQLFTLLVGYESDALKLWNNNRDDIFAEMMRLNPKLSRDECKKIGFCFLYDGDLAYNFNKLELPNGHVRDICNKIDSDITLLISRIQTLLPQIWEDIPTTATKDRTNASKFSRLMQHIERHLALVCIKVATNMGLEVGDICHDGLLISNDGHVPDSSIIEQFISRCTADIQKMTGFEVGLSLKHMDLPGWAEGYKHSDEKDRDGDDEDEDEEDDPYRYSQVLAKFERNHCKISYKNCFLMECTDKIILFNKAELEHESAELFYNIVDGRSGKKVKKPFLQTGCEYYRDPNKRVYDDMDFYPPPLQCPSNMYNLWKPFALDLDTPYTPDEIGKQAVLDHIKILCNHEKKVSDYLESWIAQMIQYPAVKTVMPTLISEEGAGKGNFIKILRALLGTNRVIESSSPDRDVWGQFNSLMSDSFLVVLNELDKYKAVKGQSMLKELITDPHMTINIKGKSAYVISSYHRYIACTNQEDPLPTSKGDRRNFIIRCSDEKVGDKEYGKKISDLSENISAMRTVFDYFKKLPGMDKFHEMQIPCTAHQAELKLLSVSIYEQWFTDYINDKDGVLEVQAKELFDSFKVWHSGLGIEWIGTVVKFGVHLTNLKIDGVEKYRTNVTMYKIDISKAKVSLNKLDLSKSIL